MPAGAGPPPAAAHVTYSQQYRRCGKPSCSACRADGSGPGHGPYWFAYWRENGRLRSRYLGKQLPAGLSSTGELAAGARARAAAPSPGSTAQPALRVRTLGGFAVWQGEQPIPAARWTRRHVLALFTCLLGAPGYRLHREQLGEALWPEAEPGVAARHLHATLHLLRAVLDEPGAAAGVLRLIGDVLALEPAGGAQASADWLDAAAFARAAHAALRGTDRMLCRAALALYAGDYLPEEPYAEWVVARREELRAQHQALLVHLARLSNRAGDRDEAERCLRTVLDSDACHEEAAAVLMGLLAARGERSAALRVYQAVSAALALDLDLAPNDEIEALRARLLAQDTALRGSAPRPGATQTAQPTNLPTPLTSFVGRGWERREVTEALASARLLTLTGPGGCGKSRLALEVAGGLALQVARESEAVQTYPDGVWLVELAALQDAALVPRAVAATLGVQEQTGRALEVTLRDFLQPRQVLLILDNCEHLIAGCAALAVALLQNCPDLRILATSREPLGSAGEMVWHVPPLSVPPAAVSPQSESLLLFETVRLFLDRARASRPDFTVTAGNARAVLQVCQRLDGLPLAVELAAARLAVLPVEAVAARLDDCFALLTGGSRTALPRQQTLRATMEWSYGLLSEGEQRLLRRLAVFTGGCTLEAAAAVCADEGVPAPLLLDLLGGLISKSLVALEERDGAGRYRLLETVRQYGWERLEEAGETGEIRERHLDSCLALAEQAEPALTGPDQAAWLQRLEQEHDNLRAALRWARERNDIDRGLRLAGALWRFWWVQGLPSEGREWLEGLLTLQSRAAGHTGAPAVRAKALSAAAALATEQGDYQRGATLAEDSLQIYRHRADKAGAARALGIAGTVAMRQGDYARATALYEECLAVHRELGDLRSSASLLNNLAIVVRDQGDGARATTLFAESLALKRTLGDKRGIAFTLLNLGEVALDQGDYARAATSMDESLALLREQEEQWAIPLALNNLGDVARCQGDLGQAIILYKQSLTLYRDMGNRRDAGECLEGLAAVSCAQGQPQRAARLLGATAALRDAMHTPLPVVDRAAHERFVAAARTALDDDAFATAWAAGQALPLEQAIAEALEIHHAV